MRRNTAILTFFAGVFLLALCVIAIFPFLLMLSTSLKPSNEVFETGFRLFPRHVTLENYVQVFSRIPLLRFLINGIIVTGGILICQLLAVIPAAYVFAKLEFPLKKVLFGFVLAALVFPRYITAIPNFLFFSRLGMIDTYSALILPFIGSAMGIFLLRQFLMQVPWAYFEAARLDGCGTLRMIYYILIPLIKPAIGAFSIFSIVAHWNDLFWPIIVTNSSQMFTPPAGIVYFADMDSGTAWGSVMAAGVIIIAPLILMFLSTRKQFISSLARVNLK
jgi:multiple sugar transport system permease protein